MPNLPRLTGAEMVRFLESQGFRVVRVRGSHHVLVKGDLRTTVPVHGAQTLRMGTLRGVPSGCRDRPGGVCLSMEAWLTRGTVAASDEAPSP